MEGVDEEAKGIPVDPEHSAASKKVLEEILEWVDCWVGGFTVYWA